MNSAKDSSRLKKRCDAASETEAVFDGKVVFFFSGDNKETMVAASRVERHQLNLRKEIEKIPLSIPR